MCFSPQRRTIFQHLNFQKWSRTLSFLSFLLPNVLFATAACNFWCHLSAPTSAPAALTGLLLDWPDTRIYEKTQHFVTSLTFGACVSFFLLTFWLLHLLSTDLITLLLLFNSPYCRKFLFKLPSIIIYMYVSSSRNSRLFAKRPVANLPTSAFAVSAYWSFSGGQARIKTINDETWMKLQRYKISNKTKIPNYDEHYISTCKNETAMCFNRFSSLVELFWAYV